METEETQQPKPKKPWTTKQKIGAFVFLVLIALIVVGVMWYNGVFAGEEPEGLEKTTGTVIGPCKEGVKSCFKFKYTVLEEDKNSGKAAGRTELEIETTEKGKDVVSKYKEGDELAVKYWKFDPTLVYSYEKKK